MAEIFSHRSRVIDMRFRIMAPTIAVATLVMLIAWREVCLNRKIEALHQARNQWLAEHQSLNQRLDQAEEKLSRSDVPAFPESGNGSSGFTGNATLPVQLITALENQSRAIQLALDQLPTGLTIPEYDPTRPPLNPQATLPKRGWGTEQVIGPPNTSGFGDAPTAWSPASANTAEWLSVGFDQAVEAAQVRIRETSNPGAINKVTAVVNNEEITLWEGTAEPGNSPRDFIVPVPEGVQTDSVIVHVDTTRVGGSTEIDAVELVGRDGSRQWATSAKASSTYADVARSAPDSTY